jgi:DNA-directed RNA polymerase subunit H (RpoH/RPB5)
MTKLEVIQEMMAQRNFKEYKKRDDYLMGVNDHNQFIYIKIYQGKFELNTVREFLWSKFIINSSGDIVTKISQKNVVQLVIVCKNFQNSHLKEFKEISNHIQLIKSDFFNINITKKSPQHSKVIDYSFLKNKKELPIIKEDDPNCIFYNFKKGDIIRVVRSDGDICYRLVK